MADCTDLRTQPLAAAMGEAAVLAGAAGAAESVPYGRHTDSSPAEGSCDEALRTASADTCLDARDIHGHRADILPCCSSGPDFLEAGIHNAGDGSMGKGIV